MHLTRFRLISSFLGVSLLVGGLSLAVGGQLIYRAVLSEARNRVRQDLNAAREIYRNREQLQRAGLGLLAGEAGFRAALREGRTDRLQERLQSVGVQVGLDFAGVLPAGSAAGRGGAVHAVAGLALARGRSVQGTEVLDEQLLAAEARQSAPYARLPLRLPPQLEEGSALAVAAAVPVYDGDTLLGVVYGGTVLNGSTEFVDRVRETVFQSETYRGRNVGTATVFYRDLRIATNVLTPEGTRAVGTLVSGR